MNAKTVAWISSSLLIVTIIAAIFGMWAFRSMHQSIIKGFESAEFQMTRLEFLELQHVEAGNLEEAQKLMIDRVFVGLTRLHPNRDQLIEHYQNELKSIIAQYSEYKYRHPEYFKNKPDWWIDRLDMWVESASEAESL